MAPTQAPEPRWTVGSAAPALELPNDRDGATRLADLRGQRAAVLFFARAFT